MSTDFQRTTRRYIPEDRTLHNHRYENLKSYIILPLQLSQSVTDLFTFCLLRNMIISYNMYPSILN
jgi:hypothetical protein